MSSLALDLHVSNRRVQRPVETRDLARWDYQAESCPRGDQWAWLALVQELSPRHAAAAVAAGGASSNGNDHE